MSKEKETKTIKHGREQENYHCRICDFSDTGIKNALAKARKHTDTTGHTVDVYYEIWRETTKNWRSKSNL